MPMYKPGDVIDDKLRVERTIDRGGMGIVYEVTHLGLDKTFALKTLVPEALGNPSVARRFLRESRAAAQLKGPHVCRVEETGTFSDGNKYLLMEYLDGRSVSKILKDEGPFAPSEAARILLEASEAIAEAHQFGIIHRDVKPDNLFLAKHAGGSGGTTVKVFDFGISKMERGSFETAASEVFGTPHYMSPEQLTSSKDVDARSDVWSLGVCLFELLTGELPWHAEHSLVLATKIMTEPPRSAHTLRPDLKPALVRVIETALQRDPAKRFQTAAEFGAALAPFVTPTQTGARTSGGRHAQTWMFGAGIVAALVGLWLVYSAQKLPRRSSAPGISSPAATQAAPPPRPG